MHEVARKVATNSLSLFLVSLIFTGLVIRGGLINYIIAGALLTLFVILLDPIVKLATLPFTIITLGLLSFLSTLAALFVLTLFYNQVTISAFTFNGASLLGVTIGQIHFSRLLSFVLISATIYFLNRLTNWLFGE